MNKFCLFLDAGTPSLPTDKVRFILGGEEADQEQHKMFTELLEYQGDKEGNEEWREMARWLKFEEDVEEGGNRWSKPHVGTLSLYSLFELRSALLRGTVLLDMNANNLSQIAGKCLLRAFKQLKHVLLLIVKNVFLSCQAIQIRTEKIIRLTFTMIHQEFSSAI